MNIFQLYEKKAEYEEAGKIVPAKVWERIVVELNKMRMDTRYAKKILGGEDDNA